jgi:hypothetical protein
MASITAGMLATRILPRALLACIVFIGSAITPVALSPANADVLGDIGGVTGDIWGVATDPFKLGQGSQNILDSVERIQLMLNQVGTVELRTNRDLADRITQVK